MRPLISRGGFGIQAERVRFEREMEDLGITGHSASPSFREAEYQVGGRALPKLVGEESVPPAQTIYAKIDLGISSASNTNGRLVKVRPVTGIFIPQGYVARSEVDLILYLHGYKMGYPRDSSSIDDYWKSSNFPFFALREGVNKSDKNVILVAPTLGPRSQTGRLVQKGGFDKYLDAVTSALKAYGPFKDLDLRPEIGSIILACHSGGGSPMRQLALGTDFNAGKVMECWGFDFLYPGTKKDDSEKAKESKRDRLAGAWAEWAKSHKSSRLFVYHLYGEPMLVSNHLKYLSTAKRKKARIYGKKEGEVHGHYWVPIEHWLERIQNAAFLKNR
jgi:hypothetical protein